MCRVMCSLNQPSGKRCALSHDQSPTPPEQPPTLGVATRMVAKIGDFLGRRADGDPGATVLWRGLDKLAFITNTFRIFHPILTTVP